MDVVHLDTQATALSARPSMNVLRIHARMVERAKTVSMRTIARVLLDMAGVDAKSNSIRVYPIHVRRVTLDPRIRCCPTTVRAHRLRPVMSCRVRTEVRAPEVARIHIVFVHRTSLVHIVNLQISPVT